MLPEDFFDKLDVETDDPRVIAQRRSLASDVAGNPVFKEITRLLMLDAVDTAARCAEKGDERACMVAMLKFGALQDVCGAFAEASKPIEINSPEREGDTGA